ncbi:hypothetical protein ACFWAA_01465 [Streptomyces sp. NPDC059922]|uniref:hypothetical protein n=1 Tax=Streptomyces sp. NPDC059922 TaxID=3347005 RepID=UPI003646A337
MRRKRADIEAARANVRRDAEIIALRIEAGESTAAIAREYEVNVLWLRALIDTWGTRRTRHKRRSKVECEAARRAFVADRSTVTARYDGGATLGQLQRDYGIAYLFIRDTFATWRIPIRPPGRKAERG